MSKYNILHKDHPYDTCWHLLTQILGRDCRLSRTKHWSNRSLFFSQVAVLSQIITNTRRGRMVNKGWEGMGDGEEYEWEVKDG